MSSTVGRNLRRLREDKGHTQGRLAELAGVTSQHINRIEMGRTNPTVEVVTKLSDALGVPISDLFRDDPTGLQDALGVYLRARGPWTPDQEERLRQDIELVIRLQKERNRWAHGVDEDTRRSKHPEEGRRAPCPTGFAGRTATWCRIPNT